jgi:hypothetical protein
MAQKRANRIGWLVIIGAVVAIGTGFAYRAFIAPWRGDPREPLIAALFVGVVYFICCLIGLRWAERREKMSGRKA